MKAIAAAAALVTTGAFVYAQVPQETDMAGAKHQVVFGNERVAPLSESVARRQTLTAYREGYDSKSCCDRSEFDARTVSATIRQTSEG
jgi:hypothetical protein